MSTGWLIPKGRDPRAPHQQAAPRVAPTSFVSSRPAHASSTPTRSASAPRSPSKPITKEPEMTMTRAEVQRMINQQIAAERAKRPPTAAEVEWAKSVAYGHASRSARSPSPPPQVREMGGLDAMASMRWPTHEGLQAPNIAAHPRAAELRRAGRAYMQAKLGYASLSEARAAVAADIVAMERKPFWARTSRDKTMIDALARDGLVGVGGVR